MPPTAEPERNTGQSLPANIVIPDSVVSLVELARLDRALASFPADVLVAARIAAEMTTAIRRLGNPGRTPWPPMRPGRLP